MNKTNLFYLEAKSRYYFFVSLFKSNSGNFYASNEKTKLFLQRYKEKIIV